MFLTTVTLEYVFWLLKVLKAFLKANSLNTISAILLATFSKISHVIAFLIPLKVILLMGSDRVPRYFRFFVDQEHKMEWAIGLSFATIVFYLLSLLLDSLNDKIITKGASATVGAANKMAVIPKQDRLSSKYFAKITNIFSLSLFICVASAVLIWINLDLLFVLIICVLVFYLFTSISLSVRSTQDESIYAPGNPFALWLTRNKKSYVSLVSTIIFILCFLAILYPYYTGNGPNILLSLVSFIMIRQITNRSRSLINQSITLYKNRAEINSLMLKGVQENNENISIKVSSDDLKPKRVNALINQLNLSDNEAASLMLNWQDTESPFFNIYQGAFNKEGHKKCFQWQLFNRKGVFHFERESFLFDYISRDKLNACNQLASTIDNKGNQILDIGSGKFLNEDEWLAFNKKIFHELSSIKPPKNLIKSYKLSRPLLHQSLSNEFLASVTQGINSHDDQDIWSQFLVLQNLFIERLSSFPLYIHNPSINPDFCFWKDDSKQTVIISSWLKWSLKPIGVFLTLDELNDDGMLTTLVTNLSQNRKDVAKANITIYDLKLSAHANALLEAVNNQQYSLALSIIKNINQLLSKA